jgi:hypothetical protein
VAISSLEQHIAAIVAKLTPADQRKVLDYAQALAEQTERTNTPESPVEVWRRLAAMVTPGDLDELERAIAED